MITKEMYEMTHPVRLSPVKSSVHYQDKTRFNKAENQAKNDPTPIEDIIKYINEFLEKIGINNVSNPKHTCEDWTSFDYDALQQENNLNGRKHIVWMKFTTDGYLGVVAASDDINFDIPLSEANYNDTTDGKEKSSGNDWEHNTSGIIVHHLKKQWDESFVLIFPLENIGDAMRDDIECGIGNYLISKDIPILDFYSHRFQ